uniref:Kinesin motor domain-containing protein n=1 Tax=Populus trichocarpa TaxID=3694 RepID=A0A3N7FCG8_POPTR
MDLLHLPLRIQEMEIHDKIIVTATILFRSKAPPPPSRRSVTPTSSRSHSLDFDNDNGRVRVAARLRPRNAEELILDADFNDCVELLPELKRLKLKKNNWSSESYRFDKDFTETASQKRVYEAVVKPVVVECVERV